jgi:hypothetical protein
LILVIPVHIGAGHTLTTLISCTVVRSSKRLVFQKVAVSVHMIKAWSRLMDSARIAESVILSMSLKADTMIYLYEIRALGALSFLSEFLSLVRSLLFSHANDKLAGMLLPSSICAD